MSRLSQSTLNDLPESIRRPIYNRSTLKPGIVHIGVGNFHRAHQAWYLQQLFQLGLDLDWAIIGAGVRAYDATQRDKLIRQDCLSTLIELAPSQMSAEVVGAMIDYLPVEDGCSSLIRQLTDPAIRIVSLTVTESGYYFEPETKKLDLSHPHIRHDIANPMRPCTAFGAIVAALKIRRELRIGPLTCLSCDNIRSNGEVLRACVVSLAHAVDPALPAWIDSKYSFPCSMVDCIVPATGTHELSLPQKFGIDDAVPVTHENYRQWVIEDDFCAGRPDWGRVGVTFTAKVHDYENMKIRMLNAGHQVLANCGEVMAVKTIDECMAHPLIFEYFRKVLQQEIVPHVQPVPDISLNDYFELLVRRFSNSAVSDTTRRVAFDGCAKHSEFILPIIRDGLKSNVPVEGLALAEALWARMCEGTREDGSRIEQLDVNWDALLGAAQAARHRPRAWLEQCGIYQDLTETSTFVESFEGWLGTIFSTGCKAALERYTSY